MIKLICVLIGGALGAGIRYLVSEQSRSWFGVGSFPYGTLIVNVAGCLILGGLYGYGKEFNFMTPEVRLLVISGFLGSLTTFSAFGLETFKPWTKGEWLLGCINIVSNLLLGLGAVWLGYTVADRWFR